MVAAFALPKLARGDRGELYAAALRAIRLAVVVGPPDSNQGRMGFLIGHTRNRFQRKRPCGCREEEVLRHNQIRYEYTVYRYYTYRCQ